PIDLSVWCSLPRTWSRRRPRAAGLQLRSHAAPSRRDRNQSRTRSTRHSPLGSGRLAWRQSPGGPEQRLTRATAAARTRTQRPGKHLAVHAPELVVKPDFQILRRYRRPLLLRLEHTHRTTLEDHVHRPTRLGSSQSLNLRIGITCSIWLKPAADSLTSSAGDMTHARLYYASKAAGPGRQ